MKDDKDNMTVDPIPKKIGRPVANPDHGPMSNAERQRARRERMRVMGRIREIPIPDSVWSRTLEIASRMNSSPEKVCHAALMRLKMPRKKKS